MKKKMKGQTWFRLMWLACLGLCVVSLSGFSGGGCGGGETPPEASGCKRDSDCGAGFRCELPETQPSPPPAPCAEGTNCAMPAPSKCEPGTKCAASASGEKLSTRCMAPPPGDVVPETGGRCVPRTPAPKACQTDADCGFGYACRESADQPAPATRCDATTNGDLPVRCATAVAAPRKVCVARTRCFSDSGCSRGETCQFGPAEKKCRSQTQPDGTTRTFCRTPAPDGFCVESKPKLRPCSADNDCQTGEFCDKPSAPSTGTADAGSGTVEPGTADPGSTDGNTGTDDTAPAPAADGGAAPRQEPRQDDDEDDDRAVPPTPPNPTTGVCRTAPTRCKSDADCNKGQSCEILQPAAPSCAPNTNCGAMPPPPTEGTCVDNPTTVTCVVTKSTDGTTCRKCSDGTGSCSSSPATP